MKLHNQKKATQKTLDRIQKDRQALEGPYTAEGKHMKYKFKKSKERPSTSEFWYDISAGGYLKPEQFSSDPATIKAIEEAVSLLQELENMCELE